MENVRSEFEFTKPDLPSCTGWTPLHYAAENSDANILQKMLDLKPNIDVQDRIRRTPLHLACVNRNMKCIELLLKAGAKPDIADLEGWSPLHFAVDHVDILEKMLSLKPNVNVQNYYGRTPLHIAIMHNAQCPALIDAGSNVNIQDQDGRTPIHYAVEIGNITMLHKMLESSPNLEILDKNGFTSLHVAIKNRQLHCAEVLLDAGAKPDVKDGISTPLHFAVEQCNKHLLMKMLQLNPNVNVGNLSGRTPLHLALMNNDLICTNILLDSGAKSDIPDNYNWTPLHFVLTYDNKTLQKMLKSNLNLDVQDSYGRTPIHSACLHKKFDYVDVLLNMGARWDLKDCHGRTLLWYFISLTRTEIFTALNSIRPLIKRVIEKSNDSTVIDEHTGKALCHLILGHVNQESYNVELIKLTLTTMKDPNVEDGTGLTPLNYITEKLQFFNIKLYIEFIQICIDNGAYINIRDYNFTKYTDLYEDIEFCTKTIINKFNHKTLKQFHEFANRPIPNINRLKINSNSQVFKTIKRDVTLEIKNKGQCNVIKMITTSLFKQCIESYVAHCLKVSTLKINEVPKIVPVKRKYTKKYAHN